MCISKIIDRCNLESSDVEMFYRMSELFSNLSNDTRLRILSALSANEMCVYEISAMLNISQSAVSSQLRILRNAKLVNRVKKGKNNLYFLASHRIIAMLEMSREHIKEKNLNQ